MDRYTRVVLTVIAVCLVIQTAKDVALVESAYANQVHRIAICNTDGKNCVGSTAAYDSEALMDIGWLPISIRP